MKKIILFMLLLTMAVSARTFTKQEKKEMLKQFTEFQDIVKNKDKDGFISMLESPNIEGIYLIMGVISEEDEKELESDSNGIIITEKLVRNHSSEIFDDLDVLNKIKIDLNTGKITNYFVDTATKEDKKKKYYFDKSNDSYFFYNDKNEKEYLENLRIWDKRIDLEFMDEGLYVMNYLSPNKLTPEESFMGSGFVYEFKFENNKLKLSAMYVND